MILSIYTTFLHITNTVTTYPVSLYVKEKYTSFVRDDLKIQEYIETIFVEIGGGKIVVGMIYRKPHSDVRDFIDKYNHSISTLCADNKICYIGGDFNLDLLKWETDNSVSELLAACHSKHFFNTITKPTRVTASSATIIDHICSNNFLKNFINGILYCRISDHSETEFEKNEEIAVNSRNFSNDNITFFKKTLNEVC